MQVFNLLCNDILGLLRGTNAPHLGEGIHVKRQVVQFILVHSHRGVDVVVELCELVHIIPDGLVAGMENVSTVNMNVDTALLLGVYVTCDVISAIDYKTSLSLLLCFISKGCAEQTGTND